MVAPLCLSSLVFTSLAIVLTSLLLAAEVYNTANRGLLPGQSHLQRFRAASDANVSSSLGTSSTHWPAGTLSANLSGAQSPFPEFATGTWDFVDKIIYVNLQRSEARNTAMRSHFLPPFGKAEADIIRLEAFDPPPGLPGDYGCSISHLAAMQLALTSGWKNVLVLEDDVSWRLSADGANLRLLLQLVKQPYDVILLGATVVNYNATTSRVFYAHALSSYLVSGAYFQTLIDNFAQGVNGFKPNRVGNDYLIDVFWMKAMNAPGANWFVVAPSLIVQEQYICGYVGYKC